MPFRAAQWPRWRRLPFMVPSRLAARTRGDHRLVLVGLMPVGESREGIGHAFVRPYPQRVGLVEPVSVRARTNVARLEQASRPTFRARVEARRGALIVETMSHRHGSWPLSRQRCKRVGGRRCGVARARCEGCRERARCSDRPRFRAHRCRAHRVGPDASFERGALVGEGGERGQALHLALFQIGIEHPGQGQREELVGAALELPITCRG
jgi:hypothetical protein